MTHDLTLHDFRDDLAHHFHDINAEWITTMFRLEATDREVLEHPRTRIIEPGGQILFVEAEGLGADPLYLLTSKKCAPAIHLYEKLGFQHDAEIMATYGARYERCDVAMRFVG